MIVEKNPDGPGFIVKDENGNPHEEFYRILRVLRRQEVSSWDDSWGEVPLDPEVPLPICPKP